MTLRAWLRAKMIRAAARDADRCARGGYPAYREHRDAVAADRYREVRLA